MGNGESQTSDFLGLTDSASEKAAEEPVYPEPSRASRERLPSKERATSTELEDSFQVEARPRNRVIKAQAGTLEDGGDFKPRVIPKTESEVELLETSLRRNFVFAELSDSQLRKMVLATEKKKVKAGHNLIEQGATGDFFYIVEMGTFTCLVNDQRVTEYGTGDSFGELALLYGGRRAATVRATSNASVFALDRHTFKWTLATAVESHQTSVVEALAKVPMLREYLTMVELRQISAAAQVVKYPAGTRIITKGEVGSTFYIIKQGSVLCTEIGANAHFPDIELKEGRYFGERALISKEPRAANVIATTDVELLSLDETSFTSLLGGLADRMASAAVEEDATLQRQHRPSLKERLTGRSGKKAKPNAKVELRKGWTYTTRPDIKLDQLKEVSTLGVGSFGKVRAVENPKTKELFALKSMVRAEIKAQHNERCVMAEKDLLACVDSDFVVGLVNTYKSSKRLYLLMEIVQGGELYARIHPRGGRHGLDEASARFYATNVIVALGHLHARTILYRDLKPENLLVDATGFLKLCDLGFAKVVDVGSRTYTLCGTVEYLAPELIVGRGHNRGVDWWAFGILCFEMLVGFTPFEDRQRREDATMKNILKQQPSFPKKIGPTPQTLISSLLVKNPLERLGSHFEGDQLVRGHRWFEGIDWDAIESRQAEPPFRPPDDAERRT